ncbi:DEAD/DEAH box helicase [bacterium]|nr:DEAD/DEAH box helicase [bacterium]
MALKLRDYQDAFVAAIRDAWLSVRAVLGVLPTGAGKTVCFSAIMHEHTGAAAAVVHRKEIVGQISQALARLEVKHRIIAPPSVVTRIRRKHLKEFGKSYVDPHALAGVISVQTLTSGASDKNRELQKWVKQITLAVFDEGHHYVEQGLWAKAVHAMKNAKLLFVTATPERADGKGLGDFSDGFAETMVEGPSAQWLVENGYLCKFKYKAPKTDLDVSDIPITASGDLNTKAMRKRIVESHLVGDVVAQYKQFAGGKRAIVFANDVATAEEMAAAFNLAGVPSAALSGETDQGERDHKLDEFEAGHLLVLVNVDLFDEGFDVPAVDAVILARVTESLAKYLQMIGRALRVIYAKGFDLSTAEGRLAAIAAGSKPHAMVIDPVRNWERHGMPNWPRVWSLDGREKGSRGSAGDLVPQRVCLACTQPYERFYLQCPYCGAPVPEPGGRSAPEHVDGDLMELDVEAMAALFERMKRADLSPEDYALDQARRGIPAIGRRPDMKRHLDGKHRREVLRNLVGWWVGCQPEGRALAEKHRRFFHRFGVDIGTAFTLNTKDTDALIGRIQQRFKEDLTA